MNIRMTTVGWPCESSHCLQPGMPVCMHTSMRAGIRADMCACMFLSLHAHVKISTCLHSSARRKAQIHACVNVCVCCAGAFARMHLGGLDTFGAKQPITSGYDYKQRIQHRERQVLCDGKEEVKVPAHKHACAQCPCTCLFTCHDNTGAVLSRY